MEHLFDLICKRIGSPVGRRQALTVLCVAFGRAMLTGVGVRTALAATSCDSDSDCDSWEWCNGSVGVCTLKAANGVSLPVDTTRGFNGTCNPTVAALVCASGVCDVDNKCGYAASSGTCTSGNGAAVCRSGLCSSNGQCEPASGCNVDQDCGAGLWCYESAHLCFPKIANGAPIPIDGNHLNGTCTAQVGALVCTSGVCDTDFTCGYATGHICSNPFVCRSGECDGRCVPAGGCNLDSDCNAGFWCNESVATCTAKVSNGSPMPFDPFHTSPALNGTCSSAAAAVVCASGACGSDNLCGTPIGGSCTTASTCRSGYCSPSTSICAQPLGGPAQDVYVLNPGSGTVSVMDTSTNSVITTIPVGKSPTYLVITPGSTKVYVANAASNNVSVISTATNTVTATVPVGSSPSYLGVHPDGSKVYVANTGGNSVSVILTASDTVTATIPVGKTPQRLGVSGDGTTLYVTNSLSNSVSIIDTGSNTVTSTTTVGSVPTNVVIH